MEFNKETNNNDKYKIEENNKNNKEKSFDKICKLQRLIKKESALKELCKK